MRKSFNLESANFSSDDSENEIQMSSQLFDMYTTQYYLVLNQAKIFFTQCKQAIYRLMSLNQYGLGFNIPMLLTSMIKIQQQTSEKNCNSNKWKQLKPKYQGQFHQILNKMGTVISDLLNIQIQIKSAYMHKKIQTPSAKKVHRDSSDCNSMVRSSNKDYSNKSYSSSQNSLKRALLIQQLKDQVYEQKEEKNKWKVMEEEIKKSSIFNSSGYMKSTSNNISSSMSNTAKLFTTNNNKKTSKKPTINPKKLVCSIDNSLPTNLSLLDNKISLILQNIHTNKQSQQKIYKTFQQRKQMEIIQINDNKQQQYNDNNTNKLRCIQQLDMVSLKNKFSGLLSRRMSEDDFDDSYSYWSYNNNNITTTTGNTGHHQGGKQRNTGFNKMKNI